MNAYFSDRIMLSSWWYTMHKFSPQLRPGLQTWIKSRYRGPTIQTLHRQSIVTAGWLCKGAPPELTTKRYPQIKRGNFACLTDKHINYFLNTLQSESQVLTEDLDGYNIDWMNIVRGL